MNWQQVCGHSDLRNLPFKIELNETGHILMSPVKVYHSTFQGKVSTLFYFNMDGGGVLAECAINTGMGTKVADVARTSSERFERVRSEVQCSIAPKIYVEVISDSHTNQEINQKKALYFAMGALDVWICSEHGYMKFYDTDGELSASTLAPNFPRQI